MTVRNLLLATLIAIFSGTALFAQGWDRTYPGFESRNNPAVIRTLPLNDGGTIALVKDTWNAGGGVPKFFLLRLDAAGTLQQRVNFDFGADERAIDLTATPDGGYAVLYEHRQGQDFDSWRHFLLRVDENLQILWNKPVTAAGELAVAAKSYSGGFMVYSRAPVPPGGAPQRMYRTDISGSVLDQQTWGADSAYTISMERLQDGRFIALGYLYPPTPNATSKISVTRFSAAGALEASFDHDPGFHNFARTIAACPDGQFVMAGMRDGTLAYLVKMDPNFNVAWERTYPRISGTPNGNRTARRQRLLGHRLVRKPRAAS